MHLALFQWGGNICKTFVTGVVVTDLSGEPRDGSISFVWLLASHLHYAIQPSTISPHKLLFKKITQER